jgi:glycosyltransferase involved in cell wall biosynthesis
MYRLKICFVTTTPLIIHFFLKGIIQRLSKDFDITIVLSNDEDFFLLNGMEKFVKFKFIDITRDINIFRDVRALYCLLVFFLFNRFDVVHTIAPKAGLIGQLAAFVCRVKFRVHTFQGEVWVCMSGLKRFFLKKLDWLCAVLSSYVLVVSESERQFLIHQGVLDAGRGSIIGAGSISGVDLNYHKQCCCRVDTRADLGFKDTDVLLLYVGRLNSDKGIRLLLNAFETTARRHSFVHLVVVGRDEESWSLEFSKCKFADRIHYVGFQLDTRKFFQISDVICLPSKREGFGMVLLEAAAYKIPALGSRIYGIVDAVVDGKSGLLFDNENELGGNMDQVILNSSFRRQLGDYAYRRVLTQFDQEFFIEAYKNFYLNSCNIN